VTFARPLVFALTVTFVPTKSTFAFEDATPAMTPAMMPAMTPAMKMRRRRVPRDRCARRQNV